MYAVMNFIVILFSPFPQTNRESGLPEHVKNRIFTVYNYVNLYITHI